jgi:hypothetical protein
MTEQATAIKEVSDESLAEILGTGSATVMTADEDSEKSGFFSRKSGTEFLDNVDASTNDDKDKPPADADEPAENPDDTPANADDTPANSDDAPANTDDAPADKPADKPDDLTFLEKDPAETEAAAAEAAKDDKTKGPGGRPTGLHSVTSTLIEEGLLVPFEGEDDLSQYKSDDHLELIKMNIEKIKKDNLADTQNQFFGSLPEEMQAAYQYISSGGTDLKGLFQSLGASREIQEMDIATEGGQEVTVRSFLQASGFGNKEEIDEEVNGIKDRGELEKKSKQFHPKLQAMQDNVVNQRLQYQEEQQRLRQEQSQIYSDSIYNVLAPGDLNGIKISQKQQDMLFTGLTQATFPSASGGNTNLLGHLLEDIQWKNPNHQLLAEAVLLLSDRDAYHKQIRESAKQEANADTARTLKKAESQKKGSSSTPEESPKAGGQRNTVTRKNGPPRSMFARD